MVQWKKLKTTHNTYDMTPHAFPIPKNPQMKDMKTPEI